jgi:hypothetical protein
MNNDQNKRLSKLLGIKPIITYYYMVHYSPTIALHCDEDYDYEESADLRSYLNLIDVIDMDQYNKRDTTIREFDLRKAKKEAKQYRIHRVEFEYPDFSIPENFIKLPLVLDIAFEFDGDIQKSLDYMESLLEFLNSEDADPESRQNTIKIANCIDWKYKGKS